MLEKELQKTILEFLQYEENKGNLYFFRSNSFAGKFQRPDGSQGWVKNNKPGNPDIICCVKQKSAIGIKGLFVGLECKAANGKQSEYQKAAQQAIEKAGGYYFVVREVQEVKDLLKTLMR